MKTIIIKPLILILLVITVASCRKITKDVSKEVPVTYPTITLIGPAYVHINEGATYTDQGATLTDDITHETSTIAPISSEVDVNAPGLYAVTFTAANANGFITTATRGVLVLNYTKAQELDPNLDIEGAYERVETGVPVNVIKMDVGLYIIDNVGGSTVLPAYMTMPTDTSIDVPAQTTYGGFALDCIGEMFSPADSSFSYIVQAENYGTARRHFVRVH